MLFVLLLCLNGYLTCICSFKLYHSSNIIISNAISKQRIHLNAGETIDNDILVNKQSNELINNNNNFVLPSLKDVKYRINQLVDTSTITSIKFRYIKVYTKEVAIECKQLIQSNQQTFEFLASTLSICNNTRYHNGETGWISINNSSSQVPHIPLDIINTAIYLNKGDMIITNYNDINENINYFYLLQLLDVENKILFNKIKRRKENFLLLNKHIKSISDSKSSQLSSSDQLYYYIDTMGCQMNIADSERMESQLINLGYTITNEPNTANVIVLNTCSIRDHAEQKVYSYIGPHAMRKRHGDNLSIVVAGCVAQQEGEILARRFPEVDIVMGPQYANRLGDLIENVIENGDQIVATEPIYQMEDNLRPTRQSDIIGYVNVIYGCNERCTYCVVPNTRGVEQSRTKEAIVNEVQDLVSQGYREVMLLGQNIDSWGRDMTPKQRFADLLTAVGQVEGIERIRFITSHPKYMSERVILSVKNNPKIMPCFNIPFQAGNNEVLKNMRRGYTVDRYLDIIKKIRHHLPDAAITADCIVAFPGETEQQFQDTLDLMTEVKFEQVHTAAYSPRPNTPAADWENQLSEEVKQDRLRRIKDLSGLHALERSQRFVGRIQEVLVENVNMKNPSQVYGRNPHSRIVFFDGRINELKGKIVPVEITAARPYGLNGRIAGEPR